MANRWCFPRYFCSRALYVQLPKQELDGTPKSMVMVLSLAVTRENQIAKGKVSPEKTDSPRKYAPRFSSFPNENDENGPFGKTTSQQNSFVSENRETRPFPLLPCVCRTSIEVSEKSNESFEHSQLFMMLFPKTIGRSSPAP